MSYKAPYNKDYFYGIRGVYLLWHGEWSSPELFYKGNVVDYYDVEDYFWDCYKQDCKETGLQPDENTGFENYMRQNAKDVKAYILDLITD